MTFWQWTLAALCCYRMSVIVSRDRGPFRIFSRLRAVPKLKEFLSCTFCTSIWIAIGIEAAFYLSGVKDIPVVVIAIVFSLSAIAIILDRTFTDGITN